jgi:uncharacterized membrane protein YphA (DoxX/SURF4 family)
MEKIKSFINNKWLSIVCRIIIAVIFILSGIGKVMDLENSVKAVYNFQLLPTWAIEPLGYALPFIELLCALGILFGLFTRLSAAGIGIMSIAFFIGKLIVLFVQGRSIDCGCFGELMNTMASLTIWMDIPMLILCLILIYSRNRYNPGIGQLLSDGWKNKLRWIW